MAGPCCRFHPSCSHYAIEALQVHGFWKELARLPPHHPLPSRPSGWL
ncbi:MAG: membrane protein insertion efficiency factor YidD [Kiritimatiellia bacterium]